MSGRFYFGSLPPMLDALCEEIDRYPARYTLPRSAISPRHISSKPTFFSAIRGSAEDKGVVRYYGQIHIDSLDRLEFIFYDRDLLGHGAVVKCFFGDHDRKNGTVFRCLDAEAWIWPRLADISSRQTFGTYLDEQMSLALGYATGYAARLAQQRRLKGPGPG